MFSWKNVIDYFPKIIVKFPVTLNIVVVSFSLGLILGTVLAIIRLKKIPVLNQFATLFISYIRCTPVITQMFVVYFGIPVLFKTWGIDSKWDNIVYVYIAYALNMGGFMAETIRSSILAVPGGQREAGRSIGMTELQTTMHIIFPQAARIAMPMIGTTFILLFKGTALAYMLSVIDMIGKAKTIGAMTGHTLEGYICCAAVFSIISLALEQLFKNIDRKLDFGNGRTRIRKVKKA